jgi:FkbM family methyltransferase
MLDTFGRAVLHACARMRAGPLSTVPVPCWLPCGGWFISYGDEMGQAVLSQFLRLSTYEPREYKLVCRLIKPGMTCIDVGANQGFYTVLLCRLSGPSGRVVAFEPIPHLRNRLRRNLQINSCSNGVIEPFAVSEGSGVSPFYISLQGKESYSGLRSATIEGKQDIISVALVTLDAYAAEHELVTIDFLKLDAEGAELEILRGAEHVLTQTRPVIMCEIADVRTRGYGYPARHILHHLLDRSYVWFTPGDKGTLSPATLKQSYAPEWENLVAVPREKLPSMQGLLTTPT